MEEDKEIGFLKTKKLLELQRRLAVQQAKKIEKTAREVLLQRLVDRGIEVLESAEASYPKETSIVVEKLAQLIRRGTVQGGISGGELLSLFRSLGMSIHVETTISVEKHGKIISLAEKLKSEEN